MKSEEAKIQREAVEQIDLIFKARWPRFLVGIKDSKGNINSVSPIFHTPNGGVRGGKGEAGRKQAQRTGAMLKGLGVRSGIPDLILPISNGVYDQLWIEAKEPKGKQFHNQEVWEGFCFETNINYTVCYSTQEIIDTIVYYMEGL